MRKVAAILASVCLLWGCASQDPGVTGDDSGLFGDFRGRWWNYYERGVDRLNGDQYEAAAADFREALRGRSRDAWSARTYGLHFSEYFPNRELGVIYFHQGELQAAEEALLKSLEDVDTARAHHYLDLVKKAQIAEGLINDEAAPVLAASGEALLSTHRQVPFAFAASDDTGVAEVRVNGNRLYQRGSATNAVFEENLTFEEGEHVVELAASDLAERQSSEAITVRVDVTAPTIAVFEPAPELVTQDGQLRLRGACADNFGIAQVRLNETVIVEGDGVQSQYAFEAPLSAVAGDNEWTITVVDAAGNENRAAVRVFRGDAASREAKLWWLQHRAPERLRVASSAETLAAVLASAYQATGDPIDIELIFPETAAPDTVYPRNELPIKGRVISQTQVASLMIQDRSLPVLSDADASGEIAQTFDTRVALAVGQNDIPVTATDSAGNAAEERVQVQAAYVITDAPESKMPLAVITFARQQPDGGFTPDEDLRLELEQQLLEQDRFNLVERAQLENVLVEQQLSSALGDPNAALQLGRVVPAQAYVVGNVKELEGGLEVKVQVVSTETTRLVAVVDTFIENAGDPASIEAGVRELAVQLRNTYPRLTGELLVAQGDTVAANYSEADGVFVGMYMLVLQQNDDGLIDEATGEVIIEPTVSIVDRAEITQVTQQAVRGKRLSSEQPLEKGMPTLTW